MGWVWEVEGKPADGCAGGVHETCQITVDLTSDDIRRFAKLTKHVRHALGITASQRRRSYKLEYEMRVVPGPAEVKVEVWHNGRKFVASEAIGIGGVEERGGFLGTDLDVEWEDAVGF